MCRMLCLVDNFLRDYEAIMKSFREVAKKDPIITGKEGDFISHDDGWGYVFHSKIQLKYFSSGYPVFESPIPDFPEGKLLMHARKAASGEPVGTLASHPHFESDEYYEVYLAHNGWFYKIAR